MAMTEVLAVWVPRVVPCVKLVQLCLVAFKYRESYLQPFARMAYQISSLAAVCKILFFWWTQLVLFEDLSFVMSLTGVVVTLALDFLWALSSSLETDALFHRDLIASDVALNWYLGQIFLVPALAGINWLPLPCCNKIVLESAVTIVLWLSFGFVWYCLWKVRGASDSPEFKKAYMAAAIVNSLCTCLVLQNTVMFALLCRDPTGFLQQYTLSSHLCETIGIFCMMCYFMFVQEQPVEIHEHMHDKDQKAPLLRKQSTLGALTGIQCSQSVKFSSAAVDSAGGE